MGIKYSSSESSSLIEAMNSNIEIANVITDRLSSGSDHLISALESGKLQGAAYTAGKNLFSEIIIPSIKKLQSAIDDIQTELSSYKSADAVISGFGELDLDDLKTQKETREKQLAEVKSQIRENEKFLSLTGALITGKLGDHISKNNALHELEYQLQMGIDELKDKIEKLEWFVLQVSQYFSDSLEVLSLAIQGATQLSKIIVDSNGNYYVDGVDMTWFDKMKEQKIETYRLEKDIPVTKKEKEEKLIVSDFTSVYGFDNETAKLLYQLQQSILEKAEINNWSKERMIYEFNRLVASPVYAGKDGRTAWSGLGGTIKNNELEKKLKEEYGFSDSDLNLFMEGIIKQHESSISNKDFAHEAIQLSTFTEQSWGDRDLSKNSGWKELGAHIVSTLSNSMRVGDIDVNTEKYESSFKGDVDSGRYDDTDFNSDLDAINIYDRIIKTKTSDNIFIIQSNYNHEIVNNKVNRVNEFYQALGSGNQDNGRQTLEYLIDNDTIGGKYIKHGKRWDFLWQTDTEDHKKSKEDFYDYLKRGEVKNVGT